MNTTCPQCFRSKPKDKPCVCGYGKRVSKPYSQRKTESGYSERNKREFRDSGKRICLDRSGGRCEVCGTQIATHSNGVWRFISGGAIHHRIKLSQGGSNDVSNLMAVCRRCHKRLDDGGK